MKKPNGSGGPKIIYTGGRPYCRICFRKTGLYNPVQGGQCRGCDRRRSPTPAPAGGNTAPDPSSRRRAVKRSRYDLRNLTDPNVHDGSSTTLAKSPRIPAGGSTAPTPKAGRAWVRIVSSGLPGLGKRR